MAKNSYKMAKNEQNWNPKHEIVIFSTYEFTGSPETSLNGL